jgi:hypothetical protein
MLVISDENLTLIFGYRKVTIFITQIDVTTHQYWDVYGCGATFIRGN